MSERVREEMEALLTKYRNALVPDVFAFVEAFASDVTAALAARPASAEPVGLDSRQVILAHLRGEVRSHSHGDDPCDCGPEDFGLSEEMADAMTAHRDRMLALSSTPPAAAQDREVGV